MRLHGFGLSLGALRLVGHLVSSADTQAWSYAARRQHIRLPGCTHTTRPNPLTGFEHPDRLPQLHPLGPHLPRTRRRSPPRSRAHHHGADDRQRPGHSMPRCRPAPACVSSHRRGDLTTYRPRDHRQEGPHHGRIHRQPGRAWRQVQRACAYRLRARLLIASSSVVRTGFPGLCAAKS